MGNVGVTELLVILAIVVVLFGTKKLRHLGGDLGSAIQNFRKAMHEPEETTADPASQPSAGAREGESNPGKGGQ